jgi:protocatechuate 4,5-dioxygenase beta chain/2,3-dihydroxyphenylpropionate 1,2-dioxygenase
MPGAIVAAMGAAHAPQLLVSPPNEDPEHVRQTQAALEELGRRLDAARPDTLVVFGGDHINNFFDQVVAPFVVYTAERIEGSFGRHRDAYEVDHHLAQAILERSIEAEFDIAYSMRASLDYALMLPLHFITAGRQYPIVPVYVNVYMPPQPTPRRCLGWGRQLRRIVEESGKRVAFLASGGMSHYPGTTRYPNPDFEWDHWLLDRLAAGEWDEVVGLSGDNLDERGNMELLNWMVVMGAIDHGTPAEVLTYQPSWHHGYGVLDWKVQVAA